MTPIVAGINPAGLGINNLRRLPYFCKAIIHKGWFEVIYFLFSPIYHCLKDKSTVSKNESGTYSAGKKGRAGGAITIMILCLCCRGPFIRTIIITAARDGRKENDRQGEYEAESFQHAQIYENVYSQISKIYFALLGVLASKNKK